MKVLIAGLGSIGRRHLRNLLALGEADILLYRTRRSTLPDEELDGFPVETDLEAALAQQPEAVIVSNPTALHLDVAIPAARVGCHILLEKPISHSTERIDELLAAVQNGGGKVLVGYQFRYHPGLQQAAKLLAEGAIGRPLSVRAHWGEYLPGWHPWEDYRQSYSARPDLGGGVTLTLSHPLDYLRWLLGEVRSLWAFTGHLGDLELGVEDTAEVGLQFQSGVLGSLHLDYNQQPAEHSLEVIGTQGTLRWNSANQTISLYHVPSPLQGEGQEGSWKTIPASVGENRPFERNDMFLAQTRHFLAMARGEVEPACTLEDGYQALRLALAVHRSAQSGQLARL